MGIHEAIDDATSYVEGDTNTIDRNTVAKLLMMCQVAVKVAQLNRKQSDSIRPMTNGACKVFYQLEDLVEDEDG